MSQGIHCVKSSLFLASTEISQEKSSVTNLVLFFFVDSLRRTFFHCRILWFNDDMKLYIHGDSIDDCLSLRANLDRFFS